MYTLDRNKNIFTVEKVSGNDISVTVYIETFCNSDEWIEFLEEQLVTTTYTFTLPADNFYRITVTDEEELLENYDITIYNNFLTSLIEDIGDVLCGCECKGCDDCDEKKYGSVFSKLLTYNIINNNQYFTNLEITNDCVKCNILEFSKCILTNEAILGTSDNKVLIKELIAYYYLVYYYTDLSLSDNSSSITELYNYTNIIKCINKLNIDINCIKDLLYLS